MLGQERVTRVLGRRATRVKASVERSGIIGVSLVRFVPVAPYTIVNIVLGTVGVRPLPFVIGTFVGLVPGLIGMAFLGESLAQVLRRPSWQTLAVAAGVFVSLLALGWGAKYMYRRRSVRRATGSPRNPSEGHDTVHET
jgi:uncharacterized membrane protein YdjX (TVP38/TMEM64 family)